MPFLGAVPFHGSEDNPGPLPAIGAGFESDALDELAMPLTIREARPQDVGTLVDLIRALSVYERLESECQTDPKGLEEALFGPRPFVEALLAITDGEPIGFALYFQNFSTFLGRPGIYLEDLFVIPSHRGRGIGKALLAEVAARAVARGCGRFEWSVLKWNEPAIQFYRSLGAVPMEEWQVYRLAGPRLKALAARQERPGEGPS
ncbi:MAG: hypothetical protein DIJKHBIC_03688 [Thermoanaerobaculia bacterium]|nr:hypothetical protein [Thermoanaerobaculia bacterium]